MNARSLNGKNLFAPSGFSQTRPSMCDSLDFRTAAGYLTRSQVANTVTAPKPMKDSVVVTVEVAAVNKFASTTNGVLAAT